MNNSTVVSYRLSNLKLPLDHKPSDLRTEVLTFLNLQDDELLNLHVFRRGYDARKKSNIHFIYTLDLQFSTDVDISLLISKNHLQKTPDMEYKPVFSATEGSSYASSPGYQRPVVVGTGPCGLFAALTLAQLGLKPLVIERGKAVRERTKDTWGFWRKKYLIKKAMYNLAREERVHFRTGNYGLKPRTKGIWAERLWRKWSEEEHRKRFYM